MKILMVNKFLHPAGGAESYVFRLGAYWAAQGHEVEYFGMEHPERCVGNRWNLYTSSMDFHGGSLLTKATYPPRVIYSAEAKRKLGMLLEQFQPDVLHLNNFNYQLTPAVLVAAEQYRKKSGNPLRIIYTAHDYQLVCPNHMLYRPQERQVCERCIQDGFGSCARGRCIHGSRARSLLGTMEAVYWNWRNIYSTIDVIVCPSQFVKEKLDSNPVLAEKTATLYNFVEPVPQKPVEKENYVLFFGRYSAEKGIETLLEVCRALPQIPFVFAGSGPLEGRLAGIPNVSNLGFLRGDALENTIRKARFSVCPSVWYEPFGLSAFESIQLGTPVICADTGGLAEAMGEHRCGVLFRAGDRAALQTAIERLWEDSAALAHCEEACKTVPARTLSAYCEELLKLYCPQS